jgi:MYXO-CTERM domain-containing protein
VNDGTVDSAYGEATFEVYLGLPEPPDGGVDPDGGLGDGAVGDGGIEPPIVMRDRGGCSTTGTPAPSLWLIIGLLGLVARRRRP